MTGLPPTIDRFARFVAVGAVVFPVNVGLTALLHEVIGIGAEGAFAIALAVVFAIGFVANRHLVFDAGAGRAAHQLARYLPAAVAFRGLQFVSFLALHTWLGAPYLAAVVVVLAFWLVVKFLVFRAFVFRMPAE